MKAVKFFDKLQEKNDSGLVANQVQEEYEAMVWWIKKVLAIVSRLLKQFKESQVQYNPRSENSRAGALSKLASSIALELGRMIYIEMLDCPSIEEHEDRWRAVLDKSYLRLLKNDAVLESEQGAKEIKRRALKFTLDGSQMLRSCYTKIKHRPFLKCISLAEATYVLREVHEGVRGNHHGAELEPSLTKHIGKATTG